MPDTLEPEDYPISFIGGPNDLLRLYPTEMSRLGALSAFWVSTENALCHLFEALVADPKIAHAAFYSMESSRGRRNLVSAVARTSGLEKEHIVHVEQAIDALRMATDQRNRILHGLLQWDSVSGDIALYVHKTATKTPLKIESNVSEQLRKAILSCYRAHALLSLVSYLIDLVNRPEKDTPRIQSIEGFIQKVRKDNPQ